MKKQPFAIVVLSILVACSLVLGGCGAVMRVEPSSADLCNGPVQLTAHMVEVEYYLTAAAVAEDVPPEHESGQWLVWYRDGQMVHEEDVTEPFGDEDLDYEAHYWADQPGAYYATLWNYDEGDGPYKEYQSNVSLVSPCQSSGRADVAVVIYGGWDGIPVKAWVGGTEQETLYTAHDANGDAAVLWTFYPPADKAWGVSVAPQVPAGKDPVRWQYKLVRITTRGGSTVESPTSTSTTIWQGAEKVFYFQLVDIGAK